jgi:hypothetical protein
LHVSADVEFAERKIEDLNVSGALRGKEMRNATTRCRDGNITLMVMNLRRRYYARTEAMTWWPVSIIE